MRFCSHRRYCLCLFAFVLLCSVEAFGDGASDADDSVQLGEEYVEYANYKGKSSKHATAPKSSSSSIARKIAWYIPNRLLDIVDIIKLDVGVGPSFGAVARVTKYGQVGYRTFAPISIRAGLRGRKLPVFIERSSEIGVGPAFLQSHDRDVSAGEIGAGVDLLLAGAYAGVALDEIVDFVAGFACVDLKSDDL